MFNDNHLDAPLVSRRGLMVGGIGIASAAAGYLVRRGVDRARLSAADVANGEFRRQAAAIRAAQARQTVEEVVALRKKYQDPIFGKARVWEMIEKLGMCVDASDDSLMCTSQLLHVQQILEAMEQDGVQDRDLFLVALLHDIGKVMLLANAAPEHVVGYITPLGMPSHGIGLENVIFQFGHDEFMYSRIKDLVPEHVAWTIRYHSGRVDELRPYCDAKDLAHLDGCLARFQPFDMCRKSYRHLPRVDMAKYRALIEDMFPEPILF
jgi:inositol oxygenase